MFRIYIFYMLLIWGGDVFDFVAYLFHLPQVTLFSRILAFFMAAIIDQKFVKEWSHEKQSIDATLVGIIVLSGSLYLYKAVMPDLSWDTVSYHLYLQLPGFRDVFQYNFAPGMIGSVMFCLADRMFYWFREFLGYRLGTILNYIIVILVILQVRQIYSKIFRRNWIASILAAGSVLVYHCLLIYCGTYMVDLFAIPLIMEILYRILFPNYTHKELYWVIFLSAFSLSFKLTNIVYIIPIVLIYGYSYIKINSFQNSIRLIILLCIALSFPSLIYLLYAYLETGNPLFPFYNAIFQSPFFPVVNFKDVRWGPQLWYEYVLWPVYIVFFPEYRLSEIYDLFPHAFAAPLISLVICAISAIHQWRENNEERSHKQLSIFKIHLIFFISLYLWSLTTGYTRYYVLGFIMGNMCFIMMLEKVWNGKVIYRIGGVALTLLLLISPFLTAKKIIEGREWSWRVSIRHEFKDNLKKCWNDRKFSSHEMEAKIDAFVAGWYGNGLIANIKSADVPILSYSVIGGTTNEKIKEIFNHRLQELSTKGSIYDLECINSPEELERLFASYNNMGMLISNVELLDGTIFDEKRPWLLQLEKRERARNQAIFFMEPGQIIELNATEENYILDFLLGFFRDPKQGMRGYTLSFVAITNDGREEILLEQEIPDRGWIKVKKDIFVGNLHKISEIRMFCKNQNGEIIDPPKWNPITIINLSEMSKSC